MDFTANMATLLGRFRRERNGAVADSMRLYGKAYGLNYGVSLPTVRSIARAEEPDHAYAKYLYQQEVRCLRLSALHLANPEALTPDEMQIWEQGIINNEVAEEAAFALFSHTKVLPELFARWLSQENPLLHYTALLAAARYPHPDLAWAELARETLRRAEASVATYATHLVAQGVVALFVRLATQDETSRQTIQRLAGSLAQTPAEAFLREELSWRL